MYLDGEIVEVQKLERPALPAYVRIRIAIGETRREIRNTFSRSWSTHETAIANVHVDCSKKGLD